MLVVMDINHLLGGDPPDFDASALPCFLRVIRTRPWARYHIATTTLIQLKIQRVPTHTALLAQLWFFLNVLFLPALPERLHSNEECELGIQLTH